jgi:curved DNA-binding protein CbpA
MRIQQAYEVLSNPRSRARYDAGLLLAASAEQQQQRTPAPYTGQIGYRSPLRCGLILAEGVEQLGALWCRRFSPGPISFAPTAKFW